MKELIALSTKTITLERNEYLKTAGKTDDNIYFIESGSVRIFVHDDMEERIIRFGYQQNLIVCMESYLTGSPSPTLIQALKKTVLSVITRAQGDTFLQVDENRMTWIKMLENLVLQQLEREVDLLTTSPLERYNRVLKRSPKLFQEIPNKHIANYLRMSAETLSRLKKS